MSGPDAPSPAGNEASGTQIDQPGGLIYQENNQNGAVVDAPLPYFIKIGHDKHGGMVEPDLVGGYRASNWSGTIGTFPTAVGGARRRAEAAAEAKARGEAAEADTARRPHARRRGVADPQGRAGRRRSD